MRGRDWRGGGRVGGVVMVPNPPSSGRYFCGGGKRCSVSFSHSGTHCGGGCDEEKSCVVTNGVSPLVVVVVVARRWGQEPKGGGSERGKVWEGASTL